MHWLCSFEDKRGNRCVNTRARHKPKGHQRANGRIIGAGEYQSNFTVETYGTTWSNSVHDAVMNMEADHQKRYDRSEKGVTSLEVELRMHRQRITKFYYDMGGAGYYTNHATCLCCLKEAPEHALPCGHVLCARCIRAYGRRQTDHSFTVDSCPLHYRDAFPEPWHIHTKPEHAGARILCLDG